MTHKNWFRRRGRRWPIFLFVVGTLCSVAAAAWLLNNERQHLQQYTTLQLAQFRTTAEARVQSHIHAIERMSHRWSASGGTPEQQWRQDAEVHRHYLEGIVAMALVGQDFDVRWVVPDDHSSHLQGVNLRDFPSDASGLRHSYATGKPSVGNIFPNAGGDQLLHIRYPLFVNDALDGFVIAVLNPAAILERVARDFIGVNVNLLVRQDENTIYRFNTDSGRQWREYQQEQELELYGTRWVMEAWPSETTTEVAFSPLPGVILIGGILLSALAAWLMWEMQTAQLRSRMLHRLTDRLQRQNQRRQEAELRFRQLLESAPIGMVLLDRDHKIQMANESACSIFGYRQEELLGQSIDLLLLGHLFETSTPLESQKTQDYHWFAGRQVLSGRRRDSQSFPLEVASRPVLIKEQRFALIAMVDITERKQAEDRIRQLNLELRESNRLLQAENEHRRQAEEELRRINDVLVHQASHDALTNLVNRQAFTERLTRALQRSNSHHEHAFLYLDLDNFKTVNDVCGHAAGDRLLQNISALFAEHMRQRDTLARLGGDEFGILLENCSVADAQEVANKILNSMRNFHFVAEGQHIPVGVSIGIAPLNADFAHQEEVLKAADTACYLAKNRGRNRFEVFVPEQKQQIENERDKSLTQLINQGLSNDGLALFMQPIVPLQRESGHTHMELLVSLRDDTGELRPAQSFILTADRYALSPAIDRWVVQESLRLLPLLNPDENSDFRIFVNLAPSSVKDPEFERFLEQALSSSPDLRQNLAFDLKETTVTTDLPRTRQFMEKFAKLGCEFAIDDFGSTLPTSTYLRSLPVSYLKIDGMYLRDLQQGRLESVLVSAIVEAGHSLGMCIVAKQVESAATAAVLRALGVDYLGGHYTGRPQLVEPPHQNSKV